MDPGASTEKEKAALRWSGRSRGGVFGNWWFIQLIRFFGLRAAYAFLVPVAGYFTVCNPSGYRCSKDYLRRVLGPQPFWKWPLLVYRHFFSFGITLLDRVALIMGRARIDCQLESTELLLEQLNRGRGIILLGAHVGSWEIGGHVLGRLGKTVNIVTLEQEETRLRQLFEQALAGRQFKLLTTDNHPLRSIPIAAALRRGEIVAMLGDRPVGGQDLRVPFLGGPARFPVGPCLLAAMTGAPIFHVFVVRKRIGKYRFFAYPAKFIPRAAARAGAEALQPYVEEFAEHLAKVAGEYPFQWFNFYPYWD